MKHAHRTLHLFSACFKISLVKADEAILLVGKSCTGWPLGNATKDNDPMESWHSCRESVLYLGPAADYGSLFSFSLIASL